MRLINKESITRVVDECYPGNKYKIFTINSSDGVTMDEYPTGLFVSLGITTSMDTLKLVSNSINEKLNTNSVISEVESRVIDKKYINKVSRKLVTDQYRIPYKESDSIKVDKEYLTNLVNEFKSKITDNMDDNDIVMEYSYRIYKICKVMRKMSSGSVKLDDYMIDITNTDKEFSILIINKKINYVQEKENYNGEEIAVHKRIGILIEI